MTIFSRRSSHRRSVGILTCIALAFALLVAVLPATAGAATLYLNEEPVEEGATVTLTSQNSVIVFSGPEGPITMKCNRLEVHEVVTANTGGNVVLAPGEEANVTSGCTINGRATKASFEVVRVELSGSTGTASFIFTEGGLSEGSTSTVSWVGPDATSVHIAGYVIGTLPGSFSGDFTLTAGEKEPLTLT